MLKSWIFPGGKGVNVALVLGKLGHHVILISVVGTNEKNLFEKTLRKNNVVPRLISMDLPTRHNYKIIDQAKGKDTELNEKGFKLTNDVYSKIQKEVENYFNMCDFLVLSGSLPPGITPGFYGKLIRKANSKKIITALDASGLELRKSINAKPTILRINRKEIEGYIGETKNSLREIAEAAQKICSTGIRWVVVSLGADGAMGTDLSETWYARPPKVSVTNPIGSGDTMLAGLIHSYSQSMTLSDALLFSTSLATARVMNPDISDLDLKITNDIRKKTSLQKII